MYKSTQNIIIAKVDEAWDWMTFFNLLDFSLELHAGENNIYDVTYLT